jgi:diaminopimelate epimerase
MTIPWMRNIKVFMQKASGRQGKAVPFFKLHGAGNDILVLFAKDLPKVGKPEAIRQVAHRQLGVGCDQIVEVLSLKPLAVQIWNQDGTKAEMCANGTRVFLFLAAKEGWISPRAIMVPIEISGQKYQARNTKNGYELCLGVPMLEGLDRLPVENESIPFHEVVVGNPHAVILTGSSRGQWIVPADFDFRYFGPRIEKHARFPSKTNVEFVRKVSKKGKVATVLVDTWERGAGATLSCGSGAVAVGAVIRSLHKVDRINVVMSGFVLQVRFEGEKAFLSGPCTLVAAGNYYR